MILKHQVRLRFTEYKLTHTHMQTLVIIKYHCLTFAFRKDFPDHKYTLAILPGRKTPSWGNATLPGEWVPWIIKSHSISLKRQPRSPRSLAGRRGGRGCWGCLCSPGTSASSPCPAAGPGIKPQPCRRGKPCTHCKESFSLGCHGTSHSGTHWLLTSQLSHTATDV